MAVTRDSSGMGNLMILFGSTGGFGGSSGGGGTTTSFFSSSSRTVSNPPALALICLSILGTFVERRLFFFFPSVPPSSSSSSGTLDFRRLAFTKEQTKAAIQNTGYRISPPGQKGDPSHPAVWTMAAKSWVLAPTPDGGPVKAGRVQIRGVAMGGLSAVAKVDVSIDAGKTWQAARLAFAQKLTNDGSLVQAMAAGTAAASGKADAFDAGGAFRIQLVTRDRAMFVTAVDPMS